LGTARSSSGSDCVIYFGAKLRRKCFTFAAWLNRIKCIGEAASFQISLVCCAITVSQGRTLLSVSLSQRVVQLQERAMYQQLRDCAEVVTVFEFCENVQWNIGGKGTSLVRLWPATDRFWLSADDSNASVIVMEKGLGNLEELKLNYQPRDLGRAADIRANIISQMSRCVARLHNRKDPVRCRIRVLPSM
jgi:hypothetical protein